MPLVAFCLFFIVVLLVHLCLFFCWFFVEVINIFKYLFFIFFFFLLFFIYPITTHYIYGACGGGVSPPLSGGATHPPYSAFYMVLHDYMGIYGTPFILYLYCICNLGKRNPKIERALTYFIRHPNLVRVRASRRGAMNVLYLDSVSVFICYAFRYRIFLSNH
jgi:hypothetical protein